ncbi:PLP-dependent aminotransferase family protein [Zavarzinia sp. CC-PAN008]|uniref:aminotransferase-like domain-containing protein n=1 Tax=Zavarzinia sp. CC-PAN008 TaxID=3243332 RepID=UPI003F74492E
MPDLSDRPGPRYLAIADALAADLRSGRVQAGDRLPTHRDLAWRLGVTVGTITRAYAEAARRGLTDGEVGRGTYARLPGGSAGHGVNRSVMPAAERPLADQPVYLSMNRPVLGPQLEAFSRAMVDLAAWPGLPELMTYQFPGGAMQHRVAGAQWLTRVGLDLPPRQILVTSGCQHAMQVALSALATPGAVLMTEALVYPGLSTLARSVGLKLQGLALDQEGIVPASLEAAARAGARLLYTTPTMQNPTTAIMGPERRERIAAIARAHDVTIIEDDVHGFLVDGVQAIATLAPERTVFITSGSKFLLPSLRVGFMAAPPALVDAMVTALHVSTMMAPAPMAEIVSRWILDGTAERLRRWQVAEADARMAMAQPLALRTGARIPPHGFNLWLPMPPGRRATDLVREAQGRDVIVTPGAAFAVERDPPEAIRISLTAATTREELARGLAVLDDLLDGPPEAVPLV